MAQVKLSTIVRVASTGQQYGVREMRSTSSSGPVRRRHPAVLQRIAAPGRGQMGVPAFFRYLTQKYGRVLADAVEEKLESLGGEKVLDVSLPNPNGIEFDNLYLDFNGIVHQCAHPEDAVRDKRQHAISGPRLTTGCCAALTGCAGDRGRYVPADVSIPRPPLQYCAAAQAAFHRHRRCRTTCQNESGVLGGSILCAWHADARACHFAERQHDTVWCAQQRSRRFRSAKDAENKEAEEDKLRDQFIADGFNLPPKEGAHEWDSNVITPGTPFMERMVDFLRYYIHLRQSTNAGALLPARASSLPGPSHIAHVRRMEARYCDPVRLEHSR
jgi:hypothetical protein